MKKVDLEDWWDSASPEEQSILICEKVFGEPEPDPIPKELWRSVFDKQITSHGHCPMRSEGLSWYCVCLYQNDDIPEWHPNMYGHDDKYFWDMVDVIREKVTFIGFNSSGDDWVINIEMDADGAREITEITEMNESRNQAICLAALRALGHNQIEVGDDWKAKEVKDVNV